MPAVAALSTPCRGARRDGPPRPALDLARRSDVLDRSADRRRYASPVSAPIVVPREAGRDPAAPAAKLRMTRDRSPQRLAKRRREEALWDAYLRTRSLEARNALWTHYQGFVRYLAEQLKSKLPGSVDVHDLVSAGNIGLLDTIAKYDRARGVRFDTFSVPRVRGAMLDSIRAADWVPRLIRNKLHQFERIVASLAAQLGREPREEEVAARLEVDVPALRRLRRELELKCQLTFETASDSVDERNRLRLEKLEDPGLPDPTRDLQRSEVRLLATTGLQPNERIVIEQYYFRGRSMKAIGEALKLSESRICQLHSQALNMLKRRLRSYDGSPAI